MAGQGGKKVKINYSSVHEEFDIVENYWITETLATARRVAAISGVVRSPQIPTWVSQFTSLHQCKDWETALYQNK